MMVGGPAFRRDDPASGGGVPQAPVFILNKRPTPPLRFAKSKSGGGTFFMPPYLVACATHNEA